MGRTLDVLAVQALEKYTHKMGHCVAGMFATQLHGKVHGLYTLIVYARTSVMCDVTGERHCVAGMFATQLREKVHGRVCSPELYMHKTSVNVTGDWGTV